MVLKIRKNTLYGISSIIGALLHKLGTACIGIISLLYPYIISYLHSFNDSIKITHGFFMYPIYNIAYYCTIALGGFANNYLGIIKTISISMILLIFDGLGLYYSKNLAVDYFLMFVLGFGIGISDQVSSKNACEYFPRYKGTVVTGIMSVIYLASSGFGYLGEFIVVNPGEKDCDDEGIYQKDVAENYRTFSLIVTVVGAFLTLLSILFIFPYDKEKVREEEDYEDWESKQANEETEGKTLNDGFEGKTLDDATNCVHNYYANEEDNNMVAEINLEDQKNSTANSRYSKYIYPDQEDEGELNDPEDLKDYVWLALKSWRVWRIFLISFCSVFVITLGTVVYKPLGASFNIKESELQTMVIGTILVPAFFIPVSGFLSDKFQFKYIMLLISFGAIAFGIIINFCKSYWSFSLIIYFDYFLSGFSQAYPQHIMKVFGMKHFIEIYGLLAVSAAAAYLLSSLIAFLIDEYWGEDIQLSLQITFYLGSGFAVISVIFAWFENDYRFVPEKYLIQKFFPENTSDKFGINIVSGGTKNVYQNVIETCRNSDEGTSDYQQSSNEYIQSQKFN